MKTKKIAVILLLMMLFAMLCPCGAFAYDVQVQNQPVDLDVIVINGYSMAPVRPLAKAMGLTVDYDGEKGLLQLARGENVLTMRLQDDSYKVSMNPPGTAYDLNVPSFAKLPVPCVNRNGSTYVALRFVCDVFGAPLRLSDNTLSIGEVFTAEGNSADQLETLKKQTAGAQAPAEIFDDATSEKIVYYLIRGIAVFVVLFAVYLFFGVGKTARSGPPAPSFDTEVYADEAAQRSFLKDGILPEFHPPVQLAMGERTFFDGDAYYCEAGSVLVEGQFHGNTMVRPGSDYLYQPVFDTVEYSHRPSMDYYKGRFVVTNQRIIFLNSRMSFEIPNGWLTQAQLYRNGLVLYARGNVFDLRISRMDFLSKAMAYVFPGEFVVNNGDKYMTAPGNTIWQKGDL